MIAPTSLRAVEHEIHHLDPASRPRHAAGRDGTSLKEPAAKAVSLNASRAEIYFIDPADHTLVICRDHPAAGLVELHRLQFSTETLIAEHTHRYAADSHHIALRVEPDLLVVHYRVRGLSKSFDSLAEHLRRPSTQNLALTSMLMRKHWIARCPRPPRRGAVEEQGNFPKRRAYKK